MLKFLKFMLNPNIESWFEMLAKVKLENCKNQKAIAIAMVEARMQVIYRMRANLCLILAPISWVLIAFRFYSVGIGLVAFCLCALLILFNQYRISKNVQKLIDIDMLLKYGEDSQEYKEYKSLVDDFMSTN